MTSNFSFLLPEWPEIHAECARAESYLVSDPAMACLSSRRAIELLVDHLYRLLNLGWPYRNDLAALINDSGFQRVTGPGIQAKFTLIRKLGNRGAHPDQPVTPQNALDAVRELHHLVIWAAFRYTKSPDRVPTTAVFDPTLPRKAAPIPRHEVVKVLQRYKAQDEARAQELADKDAEIAQLREQVRAGQANKQQPDDRDYSEAQTRTAFIDVLLNEAGWPLDQTRDREYPVTGMPNQQGTGYVDYVLWGADGLPLAVVEAKRTTKSPQIGQKQAELYADCLEKQFGRRPVIFYTNGYEHHLWDDASGYPPRPVQGFYTRDELELLVQRRTLRRPLNGQPVNPDIAGRYYQQRAIAAIGGSFDAKRREALLVMATGAGKTRTVIALVEQLQKANWAKRVLFLADRTALVRQAANAFKAHLPNSTTVNLVEERGGDGRVYVSTYPTMLNLINEVDERGRRFGPGYFDLIVIDEAHRSVYAKYGAIFDYFDALLVGLTATPKDEVDHNTYRLFHLEDGVPTDAYGLDEAVADHYLVPAKGVTVGTKFLRSGIKYDELSEEEKDQWDALDWGADDPPTEIGAEEINRFLFNEDTVDKVLGTIMEDGHKVAGGDRLAKTIIFAKSQAHAEFIQQRFDLGWPEYAGRFARVITHGTPYAQSLIDDFSIADKAPHIAISVDMLDTGIDVPEVANLVFFKLVRSKSKFWQMIGRGTRLCPDLFGPGQDKEDFFVFDFCGNLEYFSQNLPGSEGSLQKSLTQRLVEDRVTLLTELDKNPQDDDLRRSTAESLHDFVTGMTLDNVLVRPHRREVERFAEASAWEKLSPEDANAARSLAQLPSSARDTDEDAKRFDLLILRRQLAQLQGDTTIAEKVRGTVQGLASALLGKTAIPSVAEQAALLEEIAGDQWWVDVTLPMLEVARVRLRGLVRLVDKASRTPVYTDFEDTLGESTPTELPYFAPGVDRQRFEEKARAYLRAHEDHVALQRLQRNRQLTADDLDSLEDMLIAAGGQRADITRVAERPGGLGVFVRSLIGLDRSAATEAFARFLDGSAYNADQIRFVNLIIDELNSNGVVNPSRLFESPYTDHAPTGPDQVFPDADVTAIVDILRHVERTASPRESA